MRDLVDQLEEADASSALGQLDDGVEDRVAVQVKLAAITSTIQVCGVDPSAADVEALAANIDEFGLLHPVEVSPTGDGQFTLTQGNSRLLAHRLLGRDTIPAFVAADPLTEANRARFVRAQASENAHRKQLSILETINTMHELASPPCSAGRNEIGRIMKSPETTLKRYWRVYREVRNRDPQWHPAVAAWLNTADATWAMAARFAADPQAQHVFAETGALPGHRRTPAATPIEVAVAAPGGGPIGPPPATDPFVDGLVARVRAVLAELREHHDRLPGDVRAELRAELTTCACGLD